MERAPGWNAVLGRCAGIGGAAGSNKQKKPKVLTQQINEILNIFERFQIC